MYHAYSDASQMNGRCACAFVLVMETEKRGKIAVAEGAGLVDTDSVQVAELAGTLAALRSVPAGKRVIVHSDLIDINRMLVGDTNNDKIHEVVTAITEESKRILCEFQYVPKNRRSNFYGSCHKGARVVLHDETYEWQTITITGEEKKVEKREWKTKKQVREELDEAGFGLFQVTVRHASSFSVIVWLHPSNRSQEMWQYDVNRFCKSASVNRVRGNVNVLKLLLVELAKYLSGLGYIPLRDLLTDDYNLGVNFDNIRLRKATAAEDGTKVTGVPK